MKVTLTWTTTITERHRTTLDWDSLTADQREIIASNFDDMMDDGRWPELGIDFVVFGGVYELGEALVESAETIVSRSEPDRDLERVRFDPPERPPFVRIPIEDDDSLAAAGDAYRDEKETEA